MPPKTRCKFVCNSVEKRTAGYNGVPFVYSARFSPVYGGCPENEQFYAATPSGSIEIGTVRDAVFEPGKSYFIDFTPAD